ncbi:hypothetical protein LIT25_21330 [Bacillus sp. F19]|nr:hypothetical protein LIT25_21330 [Bacillus sp. F19]
MKTNIEAAHLIKQNSTTKYLELMKKMQADIAQIRTSKTLSRIGKDLAIQSLKDDYKEDLLRLSKQIKDEYQGELNKAKATAEKLLDAPLKQPDEKTMTKYRAQVEELRTNVMLSLKPSSAKALVQDFVKSISDPFIASDFCSQFSSVITPIISSATGAEAGEIKLALSEVYGRLNSSFATDEQKEAKEVIEAVEGMMDARIFNFAVSDSVGQQFERGTFEQMNNPESYFEAKQAEETE